MNMIYTDAHRYFLQIITSRRVLTAVEVKNTFKKCCEKFNVTSESLQGFVQEINTKLEPMHFMIRKSIQEEQDKDVQCLVFVNLLDSEPLKSLTTYTIIERGFVNKVIETIAKSEEGTITEMEAINLGHDLLRKVIVSDCENIVNRLIQGKWLLRTNGNLFLSSLTTTEMKTYLDENYGDNFAKCVLCAMVTFRGYLCSGCDKWFHRSCAKNYWKSTRSRANCCPTDTCGIEWDEQTMTNKRQRTSQE